MNIVIDVLLTLVIIFQITRIISVIRNGKYLSGGTILPLRKAKFVLEILEQANPNAYFSLGFMKTLEEVRIYKRQDSKSWRFEFSIPNKYRKIINQLIMKNQIVDGNTETKKKQSINLGSNKQNVFDIILQFFYEVYKCNEDSKIQIRYRNIRIEKATYKEILQAE
jgi:hypothetical protein